MYDFYIMIAGHFVGVINWVIRHYDEKNTVTKNPDTAKNKDVKISGKMNCGAIASLLCGYFIILFFERVVDAYCILILICYIYLLLYL